MDMVWVNLVEQSTFPQFSKPGEGTLTSLSDTCPAKWIMDMVWVNLMEQSTFPQFSKLGEGTLTSVSDTCIT